MTRTTLRGRAAEMAVVLSSLRDVTRSRRSTIVTITGRPGIGKTSLLREATEQARRKGFTIGIGKTEEIDRIAPGAPLLNALRSEPHPLVDAGDFAELAGLYDRQLWLIDRIAELLAEAAARRPILIGLDDVQWADPLTRFALRVLPSRLASSPVLWVLTSRLTPSGPIEEILAAADPAVPATDVALGPITHADLEALAADRLGTTPDDTTRRLLHGVGGNPFWAVQLLTSILRKRTDGLPQNTPQIELIEIIRRRLADVPEIAISIIRAVAVCGRRVDPAAVAAMLPDTTPEIVQEAARGQQQALLLVDENGIALPHDLIREAVYADIPSTERRRLHRARGRQLIRDGAPALAAAPHFLASATSDDPEAVEVTLRAAAESVALMPQQAATLARRAFNLLHPAHPQALATGERALAVLADAQRYSDILNLADKLLPIADSPAAEARIELIAGQALWDTGAGQQLHHRMTNALNRSGLSEVDRARLTAQRALATTRTPSAPNAARVAGEALDRGQRLGDILTQQISLFALTEATRNVGQHRKVLDYFEQLQVISPQTHTPERVRALQHLDRYDQAEELLAMARAEAGDNRDRMLPSYLFAQVWQHHNLGQLDAAETTARTLLRQAEAVDNYAFIMNARIILCGLAIYRGELTAARKALAPIEDTAEARDPLRTSRQRLMRAWLAAEEGDLQRSLKIVGPLLAQADNGSHAWAWSPAWMRTFAGIAQQAGDADMAQHAAHIADLGAQRNPGVASLEGVALQVRGYLDGNTTILRQAVDVMRHSPRLLLLANTLRDLGQALIADGRTDDGQAALQEALALYQASGAHGYALQLPDTPRRVRTRRATHGWAALTEAETHVAELIAAGHTNRSAAAALNVSPNTVSTHIRSVFTKLDVRSRVQLANAMRTQTPPAAHS